jgi:hypothetical protein
MLKKIFKFILKIIVIIIILLIIFFVSINIFTKSSNDRDWNNDQKVLPQVTVKGDIVEIKNIRDFRYASTTSYTENYYDKQYDLNKIKRVWYIVEPFSGIPGSAHTFLSFEFEDDVFISVSVEIRKEKGESFHPVTGVLNKYEVMYVWADEKDVVDLRINHRKDQVFLYPMKAGPEKTRELFLSIIDRTNKLYTQPEFYNTLFNTCTTNIVDHVNLISPKTIPSIDTSIFFPENSDFLAYRLGLIDTDLPQDKIREKFNVNKKGEMYKDDEDFSIRIRE